MLNSSRKNKILLINRLTVGVLTFGIIVIFNSLFGYSETIYENLYLKGLFQGIRVAHDFTLGLLPITSLYLIVPLFFGFFYYKQTQNFRDFLFATLSTLIWIINFFYLLWGFNYKQPSLYKSLALTPVEIDSIYIKNNFLSQTQKVELLADSNRIVPNFFDLEASIRLIQEDLLQELDIPTVGRVRIRKLPAGALLRIRTSGIYIPHAFEGHVDGGIYEKQYPFTIAHEMAHGYGYTDESVCNFIAYLTCLRSEDKNIIYSAELAYWRYLARYYSYFYPERWTTDYDMLAPALRKDLEKIKEHITKYKDWMPKMRDVIYDNYLKSHGVSAGIKSYDQMIELIAAYNAKQTRD